jgi:RNA polymerase sigma-70 factor (ECF subfamily)
VQATKPLEHKTRVPPLYHYVRRSGHQPEDARDLTQGFFARLLERGALAKAEPERGRFRSFLLASMKNYLSDEWDKTRAQKRGGGEVQFVELQTDDEEQRLSLERADAITPEQAFERRWTLTLLEQVYQRLAEEFLRQGKAAHFAALRVALAGERGAVPYADIARQTGMSEGAVKVAVHRLRRRYRTLLRETVAETVADPGEVEEELRHLLRIMSA